MLDKLRFGREKMVAIKLKLPKHIAITMDGAISGKHGYSDVFSKVIDSIKQQMKLNIPILTFYILPESKKDDEYVSELAQFLDELRKNEILKKIKVSVLGKWYDLPIVESIKGIIEATKDNEEYFVNFCINYDGQMEIVDACKLLARKIISEKIDADAISKEVIKDSLYSSYFIPPDIIIVTGKRNYKTSLLLWDSSDSILHFSNKNWNDFDRSDIMDSITKFQKSERKL